MKVRGRYITFEGLGGCGKSTQLPLLASWLRKAGKTVVEVSEPSQTPFGHALRGLIQSTESVDAITEAFLFEADRSYTFSRVVVPALEVGHWVVSDRGPDGTAIFQGLLGGVDASLIRTMTDAATRNRMPDLTIWLDIPASTAAARVTARRGDSDKFDERGMGFFERTREAYRQVVALNATRIVRLDATSSVDEIQQEIRNLVGRLLA